MNERIDELAKQARYNARNARNYLERVHNREFTIDEYQDIYDQKFAELLLFECIKIAVFSGDSNTGKKIKEHFGVEE